MKKKISISIIFALVLSLFAVIIYGQTNRSGQEPSVQVFLYQGLTFEEFSETQEFQRTLSLLENDYGFSHEFATNFIRTLEIKDSII